MDVESVELDEAVSAVELVISELIVEIADDAIVLDSATEAVPDDVQISLMIELLLMS